MLPSAPSDPIWHALAPIAQQMEALQALTDVCAAYLPWCAGGIMGAAVLTLIGVVMARRVQGTTGSSIYTAPATSRPNATRQRARRLG